MADEHVDAHLLMCADTAALCGDGGYAWKGDIHNGVGMATRETFRECLIPTVSSLNSPGPAVWNFGGFS